MFVQMMTEVRLCVTLNERIRQTDTKDSNVYFSSGKNCTRVVNNNRDYTVIIDFFLFALDPTPAFMLRGKVFWRHPAGDIPTLTSLGYNLSRDDHSIIIIEEN